MRAARFVFAFNPGFARRCRPCRRAGPERHRSRKNERQGVDRNEGQGVGSTSSSRASQSGLASPVTATTSTSAPAASANSVAYYGSWLDDASIVTPGDVWVGLATGYWRGRQQPADRRAGHERGRGNHAALPGGRQRVVLSLPRCRRDFGKRVRQFSLYGKFLIADPLRAPNAIGVAVTPLLELSPGSEAHCRLGASGQSRSPPRRCAHLRVGGLFLPRIGVWNYRRGYSRQLAHLRQRHLRPVVRARRHASDIARRRGFVRPDRDQRSLRRAGPDVHACRHRTRRRLAGRRHVVPPAASTKALNTTGYRTRIRPGTECGFLPSNERVFTGRYMTARPLRRHPRAHSHAPPSISSP